jgi:hypothetical protein
MGLLLPQIGYVGLSGYTYNMKKSNIEMGILMTKMSMITRQEKTYAISFGPW